MSSETPDYTAFKTQILRRSGLDLNLYKSVQMHRRLQTLVERAQAASFMDYYAILERDPDEYALFLDRITINVSELFRNPEKWDELRDKILPALRKTHRAGTPLKIWSAGCSYGAEPYSLAILLDQELPGERVTIHATDIDNRILAKAREGRFTEMDIRHIDPKRRDRYFVSPSPAELKSVPSGAACHVLCPEIRARVSFRAHNLLADSFESDYDLICCRNVVIYFTDEAKSGLYARFRTALRPGGVLFVGGTERIFNANALGLHSPVPFFYQRQS